MLQKSICFLQLTPELLCMLQLILQLMTRDILQNPCLQHKLPGVVASCSLHLGYCALCSS